jgi:hypothetical protein
LLPVAITKEKEKTKKTGCRSPAPTFHENRKIKKSENIKSRKSEIQKK